VSFSCKPGKVFGLLGCNGAGKTTTLRMIATLLVPTRGTITVAGHDTRTRPRDVRASIGFLTSSTGLYERLSPAETIRYFAGLYGMPDERIDARVEELVERFDLGSFRDRPCGKLSSGQKQKASPTRSSITSAAAGAACSRPARSRTAWTAGSRTTTWRWASPSSGWCGRAPRASR
jgi:sodium transport system ATP-binding protein